MTLRLEVNFSFLIRKSNWIFTKYMISEWKVRGYFQTRSASCDPHPPLWVKFHPKYFYGVLSYDSTKGMKTYLLVMEKKFFLIFSVFRPFSTFYDQIWNYRKSKILVFNFSSKSVQKIFQNFFCPKIIFCAKVRCVCPIRVFFCPIRVFFFSKDLLLFLKKKKNFEKNFFWDFSPKIFFSTEIDTKKILKMFLY